MFGLDRTEMPLSHASMTATNLSVLERKRANLRRENILEEVVEEVHDESDVGFELGIILESREVDALSGVSAG